MDRINWHRRTIQTEHCTKNPFLVLLEVLHSRVEDLREVTTWCWRRNTCVGIDQRDNWIKLNQSNLIQFDWESAVVHQHWEHSVMQCDSTRCSFSFWCVPFCLFFTTTRMYDDTPSQNDKGEKKREDRKIRWGRRGVVTDWIPSHSLLHSALCCKILLFSTLRCAGRQNYLSDKRMSEVEVSGIRNNY